MLTVGGFLLTVELLYLWLCLGVFCLQLELFLLTVVAFYLHMTLFCLQWESATESGTNKHLSRL